MPVYLLQHSALLAAKFNRHKLDAGSINHTRTTDSCYTLHLKVSSVHRKDLKDIGFSQ